MPRYIPGAHQIAYDVQGAGPATTLVIAGWVSHLDYDATVPEIAAFHDRLGAGRRLIRYDKRGLGLSFRPPVDEELSHYSLDEHVRDALAVLDDAGVEQTAIFAWSIGGPIALALAALHPSRVTHVVLYGSYARMMGDADYPIGRPMSVMEALVALVRAEWGLGSRALAALFFPETEVARQSWFAAYQRMATTAEGAVALGVAAAKLDARPLLGRVAAPVLVMHRLDDCLVPFALGAYVAGNLPHATLLELSGSHHLPYFGDTESVLRAAESFINRSPDATRPDALSKRELEVLRLLAEGLQNREIGQRLSISAATVARHLANIYVKLNVASRAAAAAYAFRNRLL